ncbi:MAG: hypothetical protein KA362_05030 [Chloroflexi bacterium]|nr:hypothetical protein [Chloroflexota bacterium]MBP6803451.1 hypothetical protein [Chloroflexota bacterium]MBP7590300.1 hypothetical protein [Chloroflexota bacterium]
MAELGETLSERERDVLQCVVNGASNKDVAAELSISQNTVKVHLRNIYTKLGVSSRTEATAVALQQGLATISGMDTAVSDPIQLVEPGVEGEDLEDDTAVSAIPVRHSTKRLSWPTVVVVAGLALVLLVIVALFSQQTLSQPDPTPTIEPFVEVQIGQTRWSMARPLTTPLANMAVVAVGLDLFEIGGETADGVVNVVHRYDTIQHIWQEMAAKPTAVADTTAAVLFGEIYVPGGRLPDGSTTNRVEAYSPTNNAWRPVANLPQPISGGLILTDGSFLYLFGGQNGDTILDTAYLYDLSSDSWRPLPSLPEAKAFATGGQMTGNLYVVGGTNGQKALNSCHAFDPTTETWAACPDMLSPRIGAGAAVLFNKLYVIGGLNKPQSPNADEPIAFSEFYDPNAQTWQVVNTPMLEDNPAWTNMGVTNVETRIYALGGRRAGELQTDTFVYTPVIYQTFIPAAPAVNEAGPQQQP